MKLLSREHSFPAKPPPSFAKKGRKGQFMSVEQPENFQHLINSTSCVCSTCAFLSAKKNLLQNDLEESLIYLCFRCWNFLRASWTSHRKLIKFSVCQHRIWKLEILVTSFVKIQKKTFSCCRWKIHGWKNA
jgi:hypothetical protein